MRENDRAHVAAVGDQTRGARARRAAARAAPRAAAARPRRARRPPGALRSRSGAVTSRAVQQHALLAARLAANSTRIGRASRAWPATSSGASPRQCPGAAPPADRARRCRAGASRARCASRRLTVPLPEPLGPSMVTTGTRCRRRALAAHALFLQLPGPHARARSAKSREGGRDIGDILDLDRRARAQAGDREGHGDAVIAVAVDATAAGNAAAARMRMPSASSSQSMPSAAALRP